MEVLFIIAEKNFRDEELLNPKEVIEKAGIKAEIASKTAGIKTGVLGAKASAISFKDIFIEKYRAVIFVGGQGAAQYFNDSEALEIAKKASEADRIIAAICIAPVILANAGVLEGRKATVWSSASDKSYIHAIEEKGAVFSNEAVVQDGNVITANGPAAARVFGEKIVKAISHN